MISDLSKEYIAIQVIRTLYAQFEKFPEDTSENRNAPFHEAFLNAFTNKLEGKVQSIPVFISLSSWMHGLNTSLGQSFFENVANLLCNGEKREFTTKKKSTLQITRTQKMVIADIITELTNGKLNPDLMSENQTIFIQSGELVDATDFTADVFYEDDTQIVCIELKTVKPNKGVFKVEKQKVLEAKASLKRIYPNKDVLFFIGFPFDPLSISNPTGYDKQLYMDYSVDFRKYFAENEFLLASELWDYLSNSPQTMNIILEIINAIATTEFLDKYEFLQDKVNAKRYQNEYTTILESWFLRREKILLANQDKLLATISGKRDLTRAYNQNLFDKDGTYKESRLLKLMEILN